MRRSYLSKASWLWLALVSLAGTSSTLSAADTIQARARTHWAFQPVKQPAVPTVKNRSRVQSPVDAFILAKLEDLGMQPAQAADKRTLIRRATYDLIGLPPTPEQVAAFVADKSPEAFATVVDRLLASPQYGERWGRHWLDVARYASSDSPHAFTYRDYVIRAFNEDLPYDQFLVQQLAADQLNLGENKRPLAGLGFLTLAVSSRTSTTRSTTGSMSSRAVRWR